VATIWQEAVGAEIAANARPVQLRSGRLVVTTSSSAWAQTLHLMSETVKARLNERLGEQVVERVVFRHAGWERPRAAAEEAPARTGPVRKASAQTTPGRLSEAGAVTPALDREQEEALRALERLGLDPALEARIAAAMKAAFVRGQQDSGR
jgi:hypothetical protein